ncbi:MAG: SLC13 family permease [Candidatus Micrarchaeia archaeon]
MPNLLPVFVLSAVLFIIFFREFIRMPVAPWQAMLAGAVIVILGGAISPDAAYSSIDWGVMLFLYGMFLLAYFLQKSWYLEHLGYKVLHRFHDPFILFCAIVFSIGFASAFLLNDTIAIIGVPLSIMIARKSGISPKPLILTLALAVTIGSVPSPLGNPQNFIIANRPQLHGGFAEFILYLGVPTLVSLFILACIIWIAFPELRMLKRLETDVKIRTPTYHAARVGFRVVLFFSFLRLLSSLTPLVPSFPFWFIAIAGSAVALLISREWGAVFKADFETLAFFIGMFILMEAVWLSGFFQQFLPSQEVLCEPFVVLASSLLLSQVLSNVPFVILYLNALGETAKPPTLLLLAAGSTLAGGITLMGAASNIIVLQSAEKRGEKFPLKEFTLIGVTGTVISVALIALWFFIISVVQGK